MWLELNSNEEGQHFQHLFPASFYLLIYSIQQQHTAGWPHGTQLVNSCLHQIDTTVAPLNLPQHGVSSSCSRRNEFLKISNLVHAKQFRKNVPPVCFSLPPCCLLQEELTPCYAKMSGATVCRQIMVLILTDSPNWFWIAQMKKKIRK